MITAVAPRGRSAGSAGSALAGSSWGAREQRVNRCLRATSPDHCSNPRNSCGTWPQVSRSGLCDRESSSCWSWPWRPGPDHARPPNAHSTQPSIGAASCERGELGRGGTGRLGRVAAATRGGVGRRQIDPLQYAPGPPGPPRDVAEGRKVSQARVRGPGGALVLVGPPSGNRVS